MGKIGGLKINPEIEPTPVRCLKCGRKWNTRARKTAICTNKDCKSIKIVQQDTGERYNTTSDFIRSKQKTKEKILHPIQELLDEKTAEPIEDLKTSEKKVLSELFQADGKTPKIEPEGVGSLLGNLPQASAFLAAQVQNLSVIPARMFGMQWLMSEEESQMIANALVPALKEAGINVATLDPKIALIITVGIYALPRLITMVLGRGGSQESTKSKSGHRQGEAADDLGDPPTKHSPITHREHVEAESEEFQEYYAASLDEHGRDKYASQRGIKKPGKGR